MSTKLTQALIEADAKHATNVHRYAASYAEELFTKVTTSAPGEWRFDGYEEPPAPEKHFFSSPPPPPPPKRCITWDEKVTDEVNRVSGELYGDVKPPKRVKHAFAKEFLDHVKKFLDARLDNPKQYHVTYDTWGRRDESNGYDYKLYITFKYEVPK